MNGPVAERALRAFVERELTEALRVEGRPLRVQGRETRAPAEAGPRPRVAVRAEGPEGEIAAIEVPISLLPRMLEPALRQRLVERARSLGYRYAAVAVATAESAGPAGARASGAAAGEGASGTGAE